MFTPMSGASHGAGNDIESVARPEAASQWRAHILFLTVDDLFDYPETKGRPLGIYGDPPHSVPWHEVMEERRRKVEEDPTVLISKYLSHFYILWAPADPDLCLV
jgi:hypothetical protein